MTRYLITIQGTTDDPDGVAADASAFSSILADRGSVDRAAISTQDDRDISRPRPDAASAAIAALSDRAAAVKAKRDAQVADEAATAEADAKAEAERIAALEAAPAEEVRG